MKPYLVDVPVQFNIWIRPECQRKQFDIIKQARPSIMFIQSDGGRNPQEWEAIRANRDMIDNSIDWDATVYRLYEDHNNGLYSMAQKTGDFVWSKVDRCVFLEDDDIPSVSFFRYCAELLEKYKDDERIECICGFNNLGTWDKCTSDYFFSRRGAIWGIATWKRVVEQYGSFDYIDDPYVMGLLKERTKNRPYAWKALNAYAKGISYDGHVAGAEFWVDFLTRSQYMLQIVPTRNMISNVGATSDSEHADDLSQLPRGIRSIFNSKTYELTFPMKHPKYVIPDMEYARKRDRIMAHNAPLIKFWRDIERTFLKLRSGDVKYVIRKIKKRINSFLGRKIEA